MRAPNDAWVKEVFPHALANVEAVAASKKRPVTVTVGSYFDVLDQLDQIRTDLIFFGGKYGAMRFDGAFDLRQLCKVYMESREVRAKINEVAGIR